MVSSFLRGVQLVRAGARDDFFGSMTLSEQLTLPLDQQQSTDNKLGLMLGKGKGRSAVAQILTRIPFFSYKLFGSPSRDVTVQKKNAKRKIQF